MAPIALGEPPLIELVVEVDFDGAGGRGADFDGVLRLRPRRASMLGMGPLSQLSKRSEFSFKRSQCGYSLAREPRYKPA
jgi:hypothetical protein